MGETIQYAEKMWDSAYIVSNNSGTNKLTNIKTSKSISFEKTSINKLVSAYKDCTEGQILVHVPWVMNGNTNTGICFVEKYELIIIGVYNYILIIDKDLKEKGRIPLMHRGMYYRCVINTNDNTFTILHSVFKYKKCDCYCPHHNHPESKCDCCVTHRRARECTCVCLTHPTALCNCPCKTYHNPRLDCNMHHEWELCECSDKHQPKNRLVYNIYWNWKFIITQLIPPQPFTSGQKYQYLQINQLDKLQFLDIDTGLIVDKVSIYRTEDEELLNENGKYKMRKITNLECIVCNNEIKCRYAFLPCCHANVCYDCGNKLKQCPTCRTKVESFKKLYL